MTLEQTIFLEQKVSNFLWGVLRYVQSLAHC